MFFFRHVMESEVLMSCRLILVIRLDEEIVAFSLFEIGTGRLKYIGSDRGYLNPLKNDERRHHVRFLADDDVLISQILCAIDAMLSRFESHFDMSVSDIVSVSIVSEVCLSVEERAMRVTRY